MKDIKEKIHNRSPKIRNPASRLPKELVRSAVLNTKEKSRMLSEKTGRETGKEPAVEYAANKVEATERRMGSETTSVVWRSYAGKRMSVQHRILKQPGGDPGSGVFH